jgi:ribonuclease-3
MKRVGAADLEPLAERLGHRFAEPKLLLEALTHPSAHTARKARTPNYQRLEFLGDRVLALAVADLLIEAYPEATEGELSRRLTQLVRAETCAEVAAELGLGGWLVLGAGEDASGGRFKTPILGDAAEAVIGAIYRDAGFAAAAEFVRRAWGARVGDPDSGERRDAKTTLQEIVQGRGLPTPVYRTIERTGADHAPEFRVAVLVEGLGEAEGRGGSKRAAEQAAAEAFRAAHLRAAAHG